MGPLEPAEAGGWRGVVTLPAFRDHYERWLSDGSERSDTRGQDERQGRFPLFVQVAGAAPPTPEQEAAVADLVARQEQIAQEIFETLAREAPNVYHWDYLQRTIDRELLGRLATAKGIAGVVELQSVFVGADEPVPIGFGFHSELLEPEHGVSAIVRGGRVESVGRWDDLLAW